MGISMSNDFEQMLTDLLVTKEQLTEISENPKDRVNVLLKNTVVSDSNTHGKGIFSIQDIDENVLIDKARWGDLRTQVGRYVNHSSAPNCVMQLVGQDVYLKSIKNITSGSELTVDYRQSSKLSSWCPVEARKASVSNLETSIEDLVKNDPSLDAISLCPIKHHFSERVDEYGCGMYAREMFMPKGVTLTGKIHKHSHLNILISGRIYYSCSQLGSRELIAPCTFESPKGAKRAFHALEDSVFTTIHHTKTPSIDDIETVENECVTDNYTSIGMTEPEAYKKKKVQLWDS